MFVINPQSLLLVVPRNVVTAIGLPLAGGMYIGSYTGEVVRGNWYNSLAFPPGRPPNSAFPIVWSTLYIALGYASHLAYEAWLNAYTTEDLVTASKAIALYYVQLGLNFMWTPLFFVKKQTTPALIDCTLCTTASIWMTRLLHKVSRGRTTWFLAPYCAWLAYATYLNAGVVYLNRRRKLPRN